MTYHRLSRKRRRRRLPEVLGFEEQKALLDVPNHKAPTGLRNMCMMLLMLDAGFCGSVKSSGKRPAIAWKGEYAKGISIGRLAGYELIDRKFYNLKREEKQGGIFAKTEEILLEIESKSCIGCCVIRF